MKLAEYNAYIFNFIDDNDADVERLTEVLSDRWCAVRACNQFTYDQMNQVLDEIDQSDFSIFNYIVVIVLDNRNQYQHLLSVASPAGAHFYINAQLFERIDKNKTLALKKRLYVVQTNQTIMDSSAYRPYATDSSVPLYAGPTYRLYAVEPDRQLPPQSPFITVFCRNFARYATTHRFSDIYSRIHRDMQPSGYNPVISDVPVTQNDGIFGDALSPTEVAHYYYNNPILRRKLQSLPNVNN